MSLDIPRGMFGLLGPNGAGKSTLMRTIATLQEPDSGSITLDGLDVLANKEQARKRLGYLPQDFGVYPKVSAEAMLDHFAVLKGVTARGERRELVQALLQQVNLWNVRKRKLGTFSGGMRQRFGIAQALIGQPSLVIVDEPTAGQVRLAGEPREAIRSLEGRIWRKRVEKEELDRLVHEHAVLSSRLVAGKPVVHVLADSDPGDGFAAVPASLEDVYFGELRQVALASAPAKAA